MTQIGERADIAARLQKRLTRGCLFWVVMIATTVIYEQIRFWDLPERREPATWDYIAQVIARGGVPYRDAVDIRTPLSAYIGASAIVVTRPFGLRDIYALRVTYLLIAAATIAFTFLVASYYFDSRRVGLLAASILLGVKAFALLNISGVQPKTPMVLFGLISLWAMHKDRPFATGIFAALSALSWQPGLLFAGAAGLGFSRYLTNWRDLKTVKMLTGAAVPLLVLLVYFWFAGALIDFYAWCFHYNATVYGPGELSTGRQFLDRFSILLERSYVGDRGFSIWPALGCWPRFCAKSEEEPGSDSAPRWTRLATTKL